MPLARSPEPAAGSRFRSTFSRSKARARRAGPERSEFISSKLANCATSHSVSWRFSGSRPNHTGRPLWQVASESIRLIWRGRPSAARIWPANVGARTPGRLPDGPILTPTQTANPQHPNQSEALKQSADQASGAGQTGAISLRPAPAGLEVSQAARSLYPQLARPLQKYLRLTKQTGRHNLQSIYEHLSKCLLYRLSARAFLEKFTNFGQVWQQNETGLFADCRLANANGLAPAGELELNSWSLVCDTLLSRHIGTGKCSSATKHWARARQSH